MSLEPIRHHLIELGLLGEKAAPYGGPDEVMLISAGPISHLSQFSLMCGPTNRRVIVRQPSTDVVHESREHSPLSRVLNKRVQDYEKFSYQELQTLVQDNLKS